MKVVRFEPELVEKIKKGQKTSTWRLFDDKDLKEGDIASFVGRPAMKEFAVVKLTKVYEKPMGELTPVDKLGHESYQSDQQMYQTFQKYYPQEIGPQTIVKIIHFEVLEWKD